MTQRVAIALFFCLMAFPGVSAETLENFLDIQASVKKIQSLQNRDGGFGQIQDRPSTMEDTYRAVEAMTILAAKPRDTSACISWLQEQQQPAGYFRYNSADWERERIDATYKALVALKRLRAKPRNKGSCYRWLLAQENEDGSFGKGIGWNGEYQTPQDAAKAALSFPLVDRDPPHPKRTIAYFHGVLERPVPKPAKHSLYQSPYKDALPRIEEHYWSVLALESLRRPPSYSHVKSALKVGRGYISYMKGRQWKYCRLNSYQMIIELLGKYRVEPPNINHCLTGLKTLGVPPQEWGGFSSVENDRFKRDIKNKLTTDNFLLIRTATDLCWLGTRPAGPWGRAIRVGHALKSSTAWCFARLPYYVIWFPGEKILTLMARCHLVDLRRWCPHPTLFTMLILTTLFWGCVSVLSSFIFGGDSKFAHAIAMLTGIVFLLGCAQILGLSPLGIGLPSAPVSPGIPEIPMPVGPQFIAPGG